MSSQKKSTRGQFNGMFGNTENDLHRDFVNEGHGNFFAEFRKKDFEYTVKEASIDKTKHDEDHQKHLRLMKVYADTVGKNNILIKLLRKRRLTPDESKELIELRSKEADDTINRDEELRMQQLIDIELCNSEDINTQEIFRGLESIYYYVDAGKKLRPGNVYREFNQTETKSKEPVDILDTIKQDSYANRVIIVVTSGDLLTECVKYQNKDLKPVVVLCGSKLSPGGDWDKGRMGVEEEIYYRTSANMAASLEIQTGFYILRDDALLYAPRILLYKETDSTDFARMNDKSKAFFSMITYAPEYLSDDVKREFTDEQEETLKTKFRNAIQTALYWGHDSLVMTPFGYGQPGNYDAADVVRVFKHVIFAKKHMYYKRLKRVLFVFPSPKSNTPDYHTYHKGLHGISHEV